MVKTTKADKTTVAAAAATPAVTPAATPVSNASSTKKAAAPKKTKEVAAPAAAAAPVAPVVAAPVVAAPVASEPVVANVDEKATSETMLSGVVAKIQQATALLASLKADTRDLQKQITHDRKLAEKAAKKSNKRKTRDSSASGEAKARNSGFMKPVRISDELATFLGKANGTVMGRHEANAEIRNYVANNGLKETAKGKGRNINPDSKLMSLLKVPDNVQLDYFNLQKFMKPHFIKIEESSTA
jgi:upstream activation factor subunit UAF30